MLAGLIMLINKENMQDYRAVRKRGLIDGKRGLNKMFARAL